MPGEVGAVADCPGLSGVAGVEELDELEELLLPGVAADEGELDEEPGVLELPGLLLEPEDG